MEDRDKEFSENFEKGFEKNFEKCFEQNFEKNFKESFRSLNEKLSKMGEEFERVFSGLGEKIAQKAQSAVEEFVTKTEKDKKHGDYYHYTPGSYYHYKPNPDRKPVYEFHNGNVTTKIYDDGTKRVEVKKDDEGNAHGKSGVSGEDGTVVDAETGEILHSEEKKPQTKADKILKILPFLDEDGLHELTEAFIKGELEIDMGEVLPFLDEDDVGLIMNKVAESGGEQFNGVTVDDLLPYADEEAIGEIFKAKVRQGVIDENLIHYVDEDCLHEIVVEYCNDENSTLDIDKIYPFLESEDCNLLFKTYLKRQK